MTSKNKSSENWESKFFSLQLDEATDVARVSQLIAYIRVASNNDIEEHFLLCQPLSTTKTGEDIFNVVDNFFTESLIDWAECRTVCTDGAPSVIGCQKGFVAHVLLLISKRFCWFQKLVKAKWR